MPPSSTGVAGLSRLTPKKVRVTPTGGQKSVMALATANVGSLRTVTKGYPSGRFEGRHVGESRAGLEHEEVQRDVDAARLGLPVHPHPRHEARKQGIEVLGVTVDAIGQDIAVAVPEALEMMDCPRSVGGRVE